MNNDDTSLYTLPNDQPIVLLDSITAFSALNEKERLYAHYLSKASWAGSLITFVQTSPESPLVFALMHKLFVVEFIEDLQTAALKNGVPQDNFTGFLAYACGVFSNGGNYKSFGDTKIIPNLPRENFETIVRSSKAYEKEPEKIENILKKISKIIYLVEGKYKSLGIGDKGVTTYFSSNCTEKDAELVKEFMQQNNMEGYNNRCFKTSETYGESGEKTRDVYEIRLASFEQTDDPKITNNEIIFEGAKFKVTRGDYSKILEIVIDYLSEAMKYADNENEIKMLEKYISHFKTGLLEDHKDAMRYWIKDKGPVVECNLGFIETYRDPVGQRGEFEGFVAMVNKEMSKKFSLLVDQAQNFLSRLPWGNDFEKDTFLRPDFTSLDVMTFAGSGIPAGINIPNYDEIRQNEGFKNVSLGNVIPANITLDSMPFLSDEDQGILNNYRALSFEVQVGLHELLGHGSGKLFRKLEDGTFNFDKEKVKNPLTGGEIDKYYSVGETYDSKFGSLGSAYEECRAEAVGLYLSLDKDVVEIFGHKGREADEIIYANWLSLFWTGCAKALEMYQPETKKWLQAHSQARYVLLRVCLEAGEGFLKIEEIEKDKNLLLTMDQNKLQTVGRKAIGDFLLKLQVYKSTGDFEAAKEMFDKYSEVPEDGPYPFAKWYKIVLDNKTPRKIFVQANTFLINDDTDAHMIHYRPTFRGYIQSWIDRLPTSALSDMLIEIAEKDIQHFPEAYN